MKLSLFSVQDHYPESGRAISQRYADVISQAELADTLGYEAIFLAEHHFHNYGVVPNPAVLLSAIAQRSERLKIGTAISVLPFRNPLNVAEDYAMLDILSGGRLVLGVGSGYLKHELEGFRLAADDRRSKFDENLGLLKRLLAGERVTFKGKYNEIDGVQINVQPKQKPVPIYMAVLRKEGAYEVGRKGELLMAVPYASLDHFDQIGPLMAE